MLSAFEPVRRSRWKIAMVLMAIIIVGLLALLYSSNRKHASTQAEALRELAERMSALEQGTHRSGQPDSTGFPGYASPRAGAINAPGDGRGEAGGMTDEEASARENLLHKQLEASFARQPPDPGAPRLEIDMLATINSPLLADANVAPKDPDIVCRRDTCRITAGFRSSAEASDWAVLYLTTIGADYVGGAKPVFTRKNDGSVQMHLYAERTKPRPPGP